MAAWSMANLAGGMYAPPVSVFPVKVVARLAGGAAFFSGVRDRDRDLFRCCCSLRRGDSLRLGDFVLDLERYDRDL